VGFANLVGWSKEVEVGHLTNCKRWRSYIGKDDSSVLTRMLQPGERVSCGKASVLNIEPFLCIGCRRVAS